MIKMRRSEEEHFSHVGSHRRASDQEEVDEHFHEECDLI